MKYQEELNLKGNHAWLLYRSSKRRYAVKIMQIRTLRKSKAGKQEFFLIFFKFGVKGGQKSERTNFWGTFMPILIWKSMKSDH